MTLLRAILRILKTLSRGFAANVIWQQCCRNHTLSWKFLGIMLHFLSKFLQETCKNFLYLQEFSVLARYICSCKILARNLWCERFLQDSCKKSLGEYLGNVDHLLPFFPGEHTVFPRELCSNITFLLLSSHLARKSDNYRVSPIIRPTR